MTGDACRPVVRKDKPRRGLGAHRESGPPWRLPKVIGGLRPKPPKIQRVKASRNNKGPADTEAQGVVPVKDRVPVAEGRADLLRPVGPGAAAVAAGAAISTNPRRTIRGCSVVIGVITVLDPLQDVASHVIETEPIGGE